MAQSPGDPHAGHDMAGGHGRHGHGPRHDRRARPLRHDPRRLRHRLAAGRLAARRRCMVMRGAWMLMGHAVLNGVYDCQDGPRGDDKALRLRHADGHGPARRSATAARCSCAPCSAPTRSWASAAIRCCWPPARRPTARRRWSTASIRTTSSWSCRPRYSHRLSRPGQRLRLRRPAGRAGLRAAGLHAPPVDHGQPRGADHPPLAGLHPHHLRRGDRRLRPRRLEARGLALPRPRAGPAPLRHRDRRAGFHRRRGSPGTRPPNWSLQASWADDEEPRAARARRGPDASGRPAPSTPCRSATTAGGRPPPPGAGAPAATTTWTPGCWKAR